MISKWITRFLGSIGFIGYIPVMPGTLGSLVGAAAAWFFIARISVPVNQYILICLAVSFFTFFVARNSEERFGSHDPSQFILDEVLGQMLTFVGIAFSWKAFITGFLYFRFLDIIKPYPVGKTQSVEGGAGICLDDIIAGIWACALLHGTILIYHISMSYLIK